MFWPDFFIQLEIKKVKAKKPKLYITQIHITDQNNKSLYVEPDNKIKETKP